VRYFWAKSLILLPEMAIPFLQLDGILAPDYVRRPLNRSGSGSALVRQLLSLVHLQLEMVGV
jgi:hypothetical protein